MEGIVGETTTPEAKQAHTEAVDADMDAALAKITGTPTDSPESEQDAPAPKDGRARDGSGKFKSADEPTGASDPETEDVNPDGYDKALRALMRDKVPESVLTDMSPKEITAWGESRAKHQADIDRLTNELATFKKSGTETSEPESEAKSDDDMDEFTEYFGEDAAGPMRKLMSKNDAKVDKLLQRIERQDRELARRELEKEYKLSDSDRWQQVLEIRNADKNEYDSEVDAVRSAATLAFANEDIADLKSRLAKEHSARDNGQSTTESRRGRPGPPPTVAEYEDRILTAITSGNTKERDRLRAEQLKNQQVGFIEIMSSDKKVGLTS